MSMAITAAMSYKDAAYLEHADPSRVTIEEHRRLLQAAKDLFCAYYTHGQMGLHNAIWELNNAVMWRHRVRAYDSGRLSLEEIEFLEGQYKCGL